MPNSFDDEEEKVPLRRNGLRTRRPWLRWVFIGFLVWLIAAAILLISGYSDARAAQRHVSSLQGEATTDAVRNGEVDAELATTARTIRSAHNKFANPVLYPVRVIPFVGRQLRSAIAVTGVAADVAETGVDAFGELHEVEDKLKTDRAGGLRDLAEIARRASEKLDSADLGPDTALLGPLAKARNETAQQLLTVRSSLKQGGSGAESLADLLEKNQKYLLLVANNGEMRAGSGMFLSTGVVQGQNGRLSLSELRTNRFDARSDSLVEWPKDLQDRWGWMGRQGDYRNLMLSPRFDVAAPLANEIWRKRGGEQVDGVIAVDPVFFRSVLRATGPITVDGESLSADNVLTKLMVDQYRDIDLTKSTVNAQLERRESLAGIAQGAFAALDAGRWDPATMAREMSAAANGRHLMVWASGEQQNKLWVDAGLSGDLSSDSLMVSSSNVGANKMDQFMKISANLDSRVGQSGQDIALAVTIKNDMPEGLPGYVTGPTPNLNLTKGEYSGFLTVNTPADSKDLRIDGKPPLVALGPDGPTQTIATAVRIKPGETRTFVIKFTRSSKAQKTIVEPSGRWPATSWTSGSSNWVDDTAHLVQH